MVTGRLIPTMANSELTWSEEIVTEASGAVSVACKVALDPTETLPKARVEGEMLNSRFVCATPVPVKFSTEGELSALLLNCAVPDVVPEALGENRIVTGRLCPAWMVTGRLIPR